MSRYKEITTGWPDGCEGVYSNQIPTRKELKAMVNFGLWHKLGRIFHFTPLFIGQTIDWRCVPKALSDIVLTSPTPLNAKPAKAGRLGSRKKTRIRHELWSKQNGKCHYCQRQTVFSQWTVEHKTPLVRGGANRSENRVGACADCNNSKSELTELEYFSVMHDNKARRAMIRSIGISRLSPYA